MDVEAQLASQVGGRGQEFALKPLRVEEGDAGWRRAKLCDWSLEGTQTSLSMLKRDESLR
jgi:hypothetical protein